jgi:hypothetical protein
MKPDERVSVKICARFSSQRSTGQSEIRDLAALFAATCVLCMDSVYRCTNQSLCWKHVSTFRCGSPTLYYGANDEAFDDEVVMVSQIYFN